MFSAEQEEVIRSLSVNPEEDVRAFKEGGGYEAILQDEQQQIWRNASIGE